MTLLPKSIIAAFFLLALPACSSLTDPKNELRVTEYGGDGNYLMQASGQVAGCRAVQNGAIAGCMEFVGKTCKFTSAECAKPSEAP